MSTNYLDKNFDPSLTSFYDKFEGNSLDLTKWSYQNGNGSAYSRAGWGNEEMQSYDTQQVSVGNGVLRITAERRSFDDRNYVSGKLVTANGGSHADLNEPSNNTGNKFSQTYGRFEAKIRLTKAVRGLWPAFWMMPAGSVYGGWPRSGEIDIMEITGKNPHEASSTIHVQRPGGRHYRGTKYHFPSGEDYTSFHVYGVRWTKEEMCFTMNNQLTRRLEPSEWNSEFYPNKTGPFDQPFHLIFNLAINSGRFSGDSWIEENDSELPIALEVEWVRVYTIENDPWPVPTQQMDGVTNYER